MLKIQRKTHTMRRNKNLIAIECRAAVPGTSIRLQMYAMPHGWTLWFYVDTKAINVDKHFHHPEESDAGLYAHAAEGYEVLKKTLAGMSFIRWMAL